MFDPRLTFFDSSFWFLCVMILLSKVFFFGLEQSHKRFISKVITQTIHLLYVLRGNRYSWFGRTFNWSCPCPSCCSRFTLHHDLYQGILFESGYLHTLSFRRLQIHDHSSNKVMSPWQDPNPVHSPPMIELGLEGLFVLWSFLLRVGVGRSMPFPHRFSMVS